MPRSLRLFHALQCHEVLLLPILGDQSKIKHIPYSPARHSTENLPKPGEPAHTLPNLRPYQPFASNIRVAPNLHKMMPVLSIIIMGGGLGSQEYYKSQHAMILARPLGPFRLQLYFKVKGSHHLLIHTGTSHLNKPTEL